MLTPRQTYLYSTSRLLRVGDSFYIITLYIMFTDETFTYFQYSSVMIHQSINIRNMVPQTVFRVSSIVHNGAVQKKQVIPCLFILCVHNNTTPHKVSVRSVYLGSAAVRCVLCLCLSLPARCAGAPPKPSRLHIMYRGIRALTLYVISSLN